MAVNLGFVPNKGTVVFTEGADWVCALSSPGEVWPSGTECWIEFDTEDTFAATVTESPAKAAFRVESDDVDAIPAGTKFKLFLRFPGSPTTEYAWFIGSVKRVE